MTIAKNILRKKAFRLDNKRRKNAHNSHIKGLNSEKERTKNMKNEQNKKAVTDKNAKNSIKGYRKDAPGAISGINTPGIELPAYNPPVPNRAWTAMKAGLDIDELSEEERRNLYLGKDNLI